MTKDKVSYLYEAEFGDVHLTREEEQIMKAMRKVNSLWKSYKRMPVGNRLILFCGGGGCDMRFEIPSADRTIESFEHITNDGGDGGDKF